MVENLHPDREGGNPNNTHLIGLENLVEIKQSNNLIYIWRMQNPTRKQYTFHNYNYTINSRIDRIYINKNKKIQNTTIFPNNLSNHDGLTLTIIIPKNKSKERDIGNLNTTIIKQKKKIFQNFWKNWQNEKNTYK